MSPVDVVPFEAAHARGVARLCTTVQWPSLTDPETVAAVCTAPGASSYVAIEDDQVVGFSQALGDGVLHSHMSFLAVAPSHRRRGIAKLLTVVTFQATGTKRMDVVTDSAAEGLVASFEHKQMSGFRIYPGA
jgi:ribosomal protein S18 acetylase RimI-like enzyme